MGTVSDQSSVENVSGESVSVAENKERDTGPSGASGGVGGVGGMMAESGSEGGGSEGGFVKQRLHSLDAYRGLIMISLAFSGFGIGRTAVLALKENPDSEFWQLMKLQTEHVQWLGCVYWDMIQPSFMFMVGMSMAYSYVRRQREGQAYVGMLVHAMWRSLALILLGVFLISNWGSMTNWSLMNVLTQIGLGYTFLFLLWGRSLRTQWIVAGVILVGTWVLYVSWPGTGIDMVNGGADVGVSKAWAAAHLEGVGAAWHKNANAGHFIDLWLSNLFPRNEAFVFNRGGYATLNFLPSIATMLFGLMCGELLRSERGHGRKLLTLLVAGVCGLGIGYLLDVTGVCPMIKRLWTPSWALFSTGWCCLILAVFYLLVDVMRARWLVFPLIVVGMNSLAIYCMEMLLRSWVAKTIQTHLGSEIFLRFGEMYEPMMRYTMIGLVFWLVCFWMYRHKYFLRI